jgi:hypothetical protein
MFESSRINLDKFVGPCLAGSPAIFFFAVARSVWSNAICTVRYLVFY